MKMALTHTSHGLIIILKTKGVSFLFKKRIMTLITITLMIIGSVLIFMRLPHIANSERLSGTPTVFVHGYKGTYNSFGNMLNRFEEEYGWGEKVLVYRVTKKGKLRVSQTGNEDADPAYIQVVFEDNRASFEDSAHWLSLVLAHLKKNHHVKSVNLVGHSMGGIVSLKYIEEYQDEMTYPQIAKFVTLGSPFDGIYSEEYFRIHRDAAAIDLIPESPALSMLKTNREAFPDHIDVLSIGSTGDLIAMPESVQALRDIVSGQRLKEIMINNETLGHSALHENGNIDEIVHDFLYKNHNKSGNDDENNLQ